MHPVPILARALRGFCGLPELKPPAHNPRQFCHNSFLQYPLQISTQHDQNFNCIILRYGYHN